MKVQFVYVVYQYCHLQYSQEVTVERRKERSCADNRFDGEKEKAPETIWI